MRMATKTKRKPNPLNAKIEFAPISGIRIPPRAGPAMPAIFICKPPRLFAAGRSSAGTISAIADAAAGDPNAKPIPKRNALARIT